MRHQLTFLFILTCSIAFGQKTDLELQITFDELHHDCDKYYVTYTSLSDSFEVTHYSSDWLYCDFTGMMDTIKNVPSGKMRIDFVWGFSRDTIFTAIVDCKEGGENRYQFDIGFLKYDSNDSNTYSRYIYEFGISLHSNIPDWPTSSLESYELGSEWQFGDMFSKRFGAYFSYDWLHGSVMRFKTAAPNQQEFYTYLYTGLSGYLRFSPFTYKHPRYWRSQTNINVGLAYNFPWRFRYKLIEENEISMVRRLHNYKDIRAVGKVNIGNLSFHASRRLYNYLKPNNFLPPPIWTVGVGVNFEAE